MYLYPLLLNRSERCCGPLDIAFELEQPGQQRLGNPEAARGQCLDSCSSYSSPGEPGAVMESPKRCIVANGLLDRPFEGGRQVFHTGRSPQAGMDSRGLRESSSAAVGMHEVVPHLHF